MKLSDLKSADEIREQDYRTDPEYRDEWDRTRFANAVAIAVLRLRAARGWSQRDLAKVTGLRQPAIARLEAGEQPPQLGTLAKLTAGTGLRFRLDIAVGEVEVFLPALGRVSKAATATTTTGRKPGGRDIPTTAPSRLIA